MPREIMHLQSPNKRAVIHAAAIALLFLAGYWGAQVLDGELIDRSGGYRKEYPSKKSRAILGVFSKDKTYSDIMLADSILSIAQNYYVDADRTASEYLLGLVIDSLKSDFPIRHEVKSERITVSLGEHHLAISETEIRRYDRLLEFIVRIGVLVENYQLSAVDPTKPNGIRASSTSKKPDLGTFHVLKQLVRSLDAHSALLSAEMYKELRHGTEGTFGGLGVLVGMRDNLLTVIKPIPSSPAFDAGILQSDRILAIDGRPTYDYLLEDLVQFMRGVPGTRVRLSLLRGGALSAQEVELERQVVHVDSVHSKTIYRNDVPFLSLLIESFSQRTADEVRDALDEFLREHARIPGLILDLRSNPGGLLDQAIRVSDLFVEYGVIVSTSGRRQEIEYARDLTSYRSFPITLMIDSESASASEIVAGALQDHQRAIVIGQPSFGKGSVQTIFELPEERALKLTIARYYTPKGRSIQNVGIVPDIWVQPVQKRKKNQNLLGDFRYRSERFLPNHLQGRPKNHSMVRSTLKGYFLAEPAQGAVDVELDIALTILDSVAERFPSGIPDRSDHSQAWLDIANRRIRKKITTKDRRVVDDLYRRHGIDWSSQATSGYPQLDLKVGDLDLASYYPGDLVEIPYTITNSSEDDISRVSVFVRVESRRFTLEKLIGKVAGRSVVNGAIEFTIPAYWPTERAEITTTIAVDADPLVTAPKKLGLLVRHRDPINIQVNSHFHDGMGGRLEGALEPLESGVIEIALSNSGASPSGPFSVGLVNLSGEQISIKDSSREIRNILPGGTTRVRFSVKATDVLVSEELHLGVHANGLHFVNPIKKDIVVRAVALRDRQQVSLFQVLDNE